MREIEMKARIGDADKTAAFLTSRFGSPHPVHKLDHYFRRPGENIQALRIRRNGDLLEFTAKRTSSVDGREDNEEFEFRALPSELDAAVSFFHVLGYEDFFIKKKDGWEWFDGEAHIELLSVNDLGWFLEIEILLPFSSQKSDALRAEEHILSLMRDAGVGSGGIERRSYREMITGRK